MLPILLYPENETLSLMPCIQFFNSVSVPKRALFSWQMSVLTIAKAFLTDLCQTNPLKFQMYIVHIIPLIDGHPHSLVVCSEKLPI